MFQRSCYLIFVVASMAALTSCALSKQLPYFSDLQQNAKADTINTKPYAPLRLQANDEVQIIMSSPSPEANQFFSLMTPYTSREGASSNNAGQGYLNLYTVSSNGLITLPVLGDIKAAGLTVEELKSTIGMKLKDYLKDPIVTVSLTNFKVTVIGEVGKPVIIPVNGQAINVLEAIGAAGDMTVFGIRKNVKVIRKLPDGTTEVAFLNFNKADVLQSPYYQLKQNDIVYVEPHKSKGIINNRSNIWIPILTSVLYVTAIIISRGN